MSAAASSAPSGCPGTPSSLGPNRTPLNLARRCRRRNLQVPGEEPSAAKTQIPKGKMLRLREVLTDPKVLSAIGGASLKPRGRVIGTATRAVLDNRFVTVEWPLSATTALAVCMSCGWFKTACGVQRMVEHCAGGLTEGELVRHAGDAAVRDTRSRRCVVETLLVCNPARICWRRRRSAAWPRTASCIVSSVSLAIPGPIPVK